MSSADAKAARRAKFEGVFEKIRDELIEHFAAQGMPQEAIEWYRNVRAALIPFLINQLNLFFFGFRISTTMSQEENSIAACLLLTPLRF